jgi:tetratricopeptide (TPR) repeat protein
MSDTGLPAESPARGRPRATLEWVLTVVVWMLVAGLLLFAGYWGWSAYAASQTAQLSTPASRAMADIKAQVARNPRDAALRVRLGEALATLGNSNEAVAQFREAIQIDPKHTGAWLDLGLVAMQQNHPDQAITYFKKVVDLTEGTDMESTNSRREQSLFYLGEIAVDQRQYDDAIRYVKGALLIKRDASDSYLVLARAYKGIGDTTNAIKYYQIALTFDPNYAIAHYELGLLQKSKGDLAGAAKNIRAALTAEPGAAPAQEALSAFGPASSYVTSATAQLAKGNAKAARKSVEIALAITPDDVPAALLYGSILEKLKDKKTALAVYQQILQNHPKEKTATAAVARLSAKTGKSGK